MIEDFQTKLKGVATSIITRVMAKLDDDPETEDLFLKWADDFANLRPHDPELWGKLKTHIQWPV